MNESLKRTIARQRNKSGGNPNAARVQGKGLQMNDNSVEGKKPAKSRAAPEVADTTNAHKVQGKGLQVNDNSAGE